MIKYLFIFTPLISGCSWMYPRDGGISLIGTITAPHEVVNSLSPVEDCFYNVFSSEGREVYRDMQLYSDGGKVSINLSVAPNKEQYTVKIYCSGGLVKEAIATSMDTSPTEMGIINAN